MKLFSVFVLFLLLSNVFGSGGEGESESGEETPNNGKGNVNEDNNGANAESATRDHEAEEDKSSFETAFEAFENNKLFGEPCHDPDDILLKSDPDFDPSADPNNGNGGIIGHGCSKSHGLTCIGGICSCNSTLSSYNSSIGRCVGKPETPCIFETCVSNACCSNPENICRCQSGFIQSFGHCVVDHGGNCAAYPSTPCLNGLKCKNGLCVCKYENHQFYSKEMKQCVSLVGGPCSKGDDDDANPDDDTNVNSILCVKHSSCTAAWMDANKCTCDEGWVESPERTCDLTFAQNCSTDTNPRGIGVIGEILEEDTNPNNDIEYCDRAVPLACINGKCACEDELKVYDPIGMKCRGLVGSVCQVQQPDCIRGAKCQPRERSRDDQGICKCLFNCEYVPENRSCLNCPFQTIYGR